MKKIPFYANTPDNTHCYQAALKMMLKHFLPNKNFSWKELEKLTAKAENLWTWPTQGLINLHKMGFEIVDIDDFDINEFIRDGGRYLVKKYGKEVGEAQIKHSDINQERDIFKEYLNLRLHQQRSPTLEEVKILIQKGYLIGCNINSRMLNNKSGYSGHLVVIYDFDDKHLILNDPGLPPVEARKVLYSDFLRAWEYPDKKTRNLTAFKFLEK